MLLVGSRCSPGFGSCWHTIALVVMQSAKKRLGRVQTRARSGSISQQLVTRLTFRRRDWRYRMGVEQEQEPAQTRVATPEGVTMLNSRIKSLVFITLTLLTLALLSNSAFGQKAPKYDSKTEVKAVKATVQETKKVTEEGKEQVRLMVKTGSEMIEVYLCPTNYLAEMDTEFKAGDEVTITGSKLKVDTADIILAREVVKGNNTLVLRDDKGAPVWTWMEKSAVGK